MSQMGVMSRPASQMKVGVSLPEIKHPLSQMANPGNMELRGVSRASDARPTSNPPLTGRPLAAEGNPLRKSFSATGRVSVMNKENLNQPIGIESIPEGVEVKYGDPSATRLPVFGSRAGVGDRADVNSRASSRMSRASTQARLEIDELEMALKDKVKTNYYDVRKKFKDNDPEGRGNVSRDAFCRILVTVLGRSINNSSCQRLMERLGFAERHIIPFTEFFAYFRESADSSYPQWMDPVHRGNQDRVIMTHGQVHANLREKAKQRFLDLADMIPQMNPGGSGRIMKSEFRQMLNRMNFYMEDGEFEKLWTKYDNANEGIINGRRLLNSLGIEWTNGSGDMSSRVTPFQDFKQHRAATMAAAGPATERSEKRTPRKKEVERRQQLDIENWLKNKFREGFFTMREAFEDKDPERTGVASFDDFVEVLGNFGLKMEKNLLGAFLSRCSIKVMGKGVPYREFLHRFQDRSETGMTHNVMTDVKHRYNNRPGSPEANSTISAVEGQLTNMFQRDFLALLGMFKKIDRLGTDVISQEEFRAAIESRFNMELSNGQFESFVDHVPLDTDGNVMYARFMQQFDARGKAASLFGPRPDMVDPQDTGMPVAPRMASPIPEGDEEAMEVNGNGSPLPAHLVPDVDMEELHRRRTSQELFKVVKDLLSRCFQQVEERYYELDDTNTRRLSQEMMYELLKSFDIRPEISRGEIRDLWKSFITNSDRTLDYLQFIRHFGFSMRSAAFPNAKVQPPRRGDSDFMIRSRKLNCASDMLQDSLRAKVDYLWEDLRREFGNMDPYQTGLVTKDEFRDVLTELCVNLSNVELQHLLQKFEVKSDGRVSYLEFLKPFALRKQTWRHGNNMLSLLQHPQPELPIPDIVEPPQKGLHGITAKLRQKLAGDWKNMRRAFRKLDVTGNGYLSLPEFRSVLKLANVVLDEDEVYHVMTEFDRDLSGKISYDKFIEETFKPETRQQSVRSSRK